jgi:hypothetical protein
MSPDGRKCNIQPESRRKGRNGLERSFHGAAGLSEPIWSRPMWRAAAPRKLTLKAARSYPMPTESLIQVKPGVPTRCYF